MAMFVALAFVPVVALGLAGIAAARLRWATRFDAGASFLDLVGVGRQLGERCIVAAIDDLASSVGRKKVEVTAKAVDPALAQEVEQKALEPLTAAMRIHDKLENYEKVDQLLADLVASYEDEA